MQRPRRQQAFSLIELMVALALAGLVTSQLMLVFTSQHDSYVQQERVVETQQDLRILTDFIIRDLRMAGFMVPRETAVGSVDGGASAEDVLCASDPSVLDEAEYVDAKDRFEAAEVTTTVGVGVTSVTLSSTSMDIDGDTTSDFAAGGGVLISDGDDVHCARITGVTGSTLTIDPATGAGTSMSPISTWAVPAIVYQLSGTDLTRNGLVLSDQVEDLQVEWWVDANNNADMDAGEFPIHDLDGQDTSKVRLGRVSLTTITSTPDLGFQGGRSAIANRTDTTSDSFHRRRAIADARLRNTR